ncbi:MAG TPA: hypothetical protein DHU96_06390 [Actinobacteria bacterium]|nr:hypothetical protein [Actinomycetota bacterium]
MNASGAKCQLITSYNGWDEGTVIESSTGCRSPAPAGALCGWSSGNTVPATSPPCTTLPHPAERRPARGA